jgi:hypothetical protein
VNDIQDAGVVYLVQGVGEPPSAPDVSSHQIPALVRILDSTDEMAFTPRGTDRDEIPLVQAASRHQDRHSLR